MRRQRLGPGLAPLAAIALAFACAPAYAVFIVNGPWLRPAAAGGTTELYMTLTSTEGATLVAVRCEVARDAAVVVGGTSAPPGAPLALPPGRDVQLKPGGTRVRMVGLKRALSLGDRVPLVLTIEAAGGAAQEIPVDAEVRRRSALDDHLHRHAH
jgi:copper(I)-binding protein